MSTFDEVACLSLGLLTEVQVGDEPWEVVFRVRRLNFETEFPDDVAVGPCESIVDAGDTGHIVQRPGDPGPASGRVSGSVERPRRAPGRRSSPSARR